MVLVKKYGNNWRAALIALLLIITIGCGGGGGSTGDTGSGSSGSASSSGSGSSSSNPNYNDSSVGNIRFFTDTQRAPVRPSEATSVESANRAAEYTFYTRPDPANGQLGPGEAQAEFLGLTDRSGHPRLRAPGDSANQTNPGPASAGDGFLFVSADTDANASTTGQDVVIQKTDMTTGSNLWGAVGKSVCTAPGDQRLSRSCVESGGTVVTTWQDNRPAPGNGNAHIYLGRNDPSTGAQLDGNGVLISTSDPSTGEEIQPGIVATTNRRVWVWWYQSTGMSVALVDVSSTPTVVFRTSLTAGAGASSFQVPNAGGQQGAIVASDGALIAVIVMTISSNSGVYTQRVDLNSLLAWNGGQPLPVADFANRQYEPSICAGINGGAHYAWRDDRNPIDPLNNPEGEVSSQIYVQEISAAGQPQLAAGGVPVITPASGSGYKHQMPAIDFDGTKVLLACDRQLGNVVGNHALLTAVVTPGQIPTDESGSLIETTSDYTVPKVVADVSRGHHLIWSDSRQVKYNYRKNAGSFAHASHLKFTASADQVRNPQGVPVGTKTVGVGWQAYNGGGTSLVEGRPLKDDT